MVSPHLTGVAHVLRQQPYEAAIAMACLISALWGVRTGTGSGAVARVLPHWGLYMVLALLVAGGACTLLGLLVVGFTTDDVRRVMARRAEQAGQLLEGGALSVAALGAFTAGSAGTVSGAIYTALTYAVFTRATVIGHTFAAAGRERTNLVE